MTEDDGHDDASKKLSPSSFGDLDVVVTPTRFTSFLATVLSLVLGHVTLFLQCKRSIKN